MVARIQDAGLANLTAAWHGYASRPLYLQWGTGSGAAKTANTVTTTSTTEARTTGTSSQQTGSVTNDKFRVTGTITAAVLNTLAVSGFNPSPGWYWQLNIPDAAVQIAATYATPQFGNPAGTTSLGNQIAGYVRSGSYATGLPATGAVSSASALSLNSATNLSVPAFSYRMAA